MIVIMRTRSRIKRTGFAGWCLAVIVQSVASIGCTINDTTIYDFVNDWIGGDTDPGGCGDIAEWDVSNVTAMDSLFCGLTVSSAYSCWNTWCRHCDSSKQNFNSNISAWNIEKVTRLDGIFSYNVNFNRSLGNWNVAKITTLERAFEGTDAFNSDISSWNVASSTSLSNTFSFTNSFNADISSWNVERVSDLSGTFSYTPSFNQDLSSWNVEKVTTMRSTFEDIENFNVDISSWNVERVTTLERTFSGAENFNVDISSWNVERVTTLERTFSFATSFKQDLSTWNVAKVTTLNSAFGHATNFNGDILTWNVSRVTDIGFVFDGAESFNQDITKWKVGTVTDIRGIFDGATKWNLYNARFDGSRTEFDGPIDLWYSCKELIPNSALVTCTNLFNAILIQCENGFSPNGNVCEASTETTTTENLTTTNTTGESDDGIVVENSLASVFDNDDDDVDTNVLLVLVILSFVISFITLLVLVLSGRWRRASARVNDNRDLEESKDDAKDASLDALKIEKAKTLDIAANLVELGNLLRMKGDLNGAQEKYETSLAMSRSLPPCRKTRKKISVVLGFLAGLRHDLGDLRGARERYESSLAEQIALHPDKENAVDVEIETTMYNLAVVCKQSNQWNDALRLFERSLKIADALYASSNAFHRDIQMTAESVLECLVKIRRPRGEILSFCRMRLEKLRRGPCTLSSSERAHVEQCWITRVDDDGGLSWNGHRISIEKSLRFQRQRLRPQNYS